MDCALFPSAPWHFNSCLLQPIYHTAARLYIYFLNQLYHVILWFKAFCCLWISFRINSNSLPEPIKLLNPVSVYCLDFISYHSPYHSSHFSHTACLSFLWLSNTFLLWCLYIYCSSPWNTLPLNLILFFIKQVAVVWKFVSPTIHRLKSWSSVWWFYKVWPSEVIRLWGWSLQEWN